MSNFDDKRINISKLKELYADEAARPILDHFANRERNQTTSTVRRLAANVAADGSPQSRGQIIRILKKLEELGAGVFKAGRKGYESRFEWFFSSKNVGQAAAGETTEVEQAAADEGDTEPDSTEMLEHRFQLRAEMPIAFELPADLSHSEAERLSAFIKTLPFT